MLIKLILRAWILLPFSFISTSVIAKDVLSKGEDEAHRPDIIVKGTRLMEENGIVTQLDHKALGQRVIGSTADILRNQQGVTVIQPGGAGRAEIALRGAESNFTVVLIDGVRGNDPTNTRGGSYDFTTLAPGEIEAVSVSQGGASSIYGSDALSGVINIVTQGPGDENSSLLSGRLSIGGNDFFSATGTARIPGKASLTLSRHDAGTAVKGLSHELNSAQVKVKSDLGGFDLSAGIRAAQSEGTTFPDASGGPRLAVLETLETYETDTFSAQISVQGALNDQMQLFVETGYSNRQDDVSNPGIAPPVDNPFAERPAIDAQTEYSRAFLTAYTQNNLSEEASFVTGVEIVQETGETVSQADLGFAVVPGAFDLERTTLAAFIEGEVDVTKSTKIRSALRIDDLDGETEPSWKVGLVQKTPGPDVSLQVSQSFKAPSFFALADALVGSPDLLAEESRAWQLGFSKEWKNLRAGLYLHDTKFDNLIDFDFTTFTLVNRGETNIRGIGGNINWTSADARLRLGGTLDYNDTEIDGLDQQLPRRSAWNGGLRASWDATESITIDVQSDWIGRRPDNSVPTGPQQLPAYSRQDVKLGYQASDGVRISLSALNLFDADYEDHVGFPSLGRTVRVGLQFR